MKQAFGTLKKPDFVRLRTQVLNSLKRQQQEEGYNHIEEGWLEGMVRAADGQPHPFAGMRPTERATALEYFWVCLVKAKQVLEKTIHYEGKEYRSYHLPNTPWQKDDAIGSYLKALAAMNEPLPGNNA